MRRDVMPEHVYGITCARTGDAKIFRTPPDMRALDILDPESTEDDAGGFPFDDSCLGPWCPHYPKISPWRS